MWNGANRLGTSQTVAGPEYQEKLYEEDLEAFNTAYTSGRVAITLVPHDIWNMYAPDKNPVTLAHAATAWEKRDHHAYMEKRAKHSAITHMLT